MEPSLEIRLNENSANYESSLYRKLSKTARDYVQAGVSVLNYYVPAFDVAYDILNCYASGRKEDFEKGDRCAPENFIHPMGATEIWTLATYISQILFGGETTRRVEPRNPDDEPKADVVNELLAWNDGQQQTYNQGFAWVLDALAVNRGVLYDRWQDMFEVTLEPVETQLPYEPTIDPETNKKTRKPRDWVAPVSTRFRKKRTKVGGFVKIDPISPYDFICDPTMPPARFQEGRFAGHRVVLTWQELKRRSELPVDDYNYVLPKVVEKLKNSKGRTSVTVAAGATTSTSRSYFERNRRAQPVITMTGSDKVDREDGGVVECWCIQIRAKPKDYDIFPEDEEMELIELLIAGETDLLSVNVTTNCHDEFPYAIGEGRPNAHMQFSPSWTLIIRGPQAYVDYLQSRHQESIARTSGNIFIGDPLMVDFEAFTNPKKDGLMIPITPEGAASGKPIDQIISQVRVVDSTANFVDEMAVYQQTAEQATGVNAAVQGQTEDPGQTLGQFDTVQQMATGRISTLARLLSAAALVPQTQRIISNLSQFLPDEITIRVTGENQPFDGEKPPQKFMQVRRDASAFPQGGVDEAGNAIPRDPRADLPDIQGSFDVIPHDGAMPGTSQRKVAALSRAVEAWSSNPALSICFDNTVQGNIDPRRMFFKLLKASDFPVGDLLVTKEQAMQNLQQRMLASGMGTGLPPQQPAAPPVDPATGMPSATELPQIPSASPPAAHPGNI